MRYFNYSFLIIILLFLLSCSNYNEAEQERKFKELEKNNSELISKLKLRDDLLEDFENRISNLEVEQYDAIYLDPSSRGYGRINTSSGFFLITLENLIPYANGYKLLLKVGNLSTAKY